MKVVYLLSLLTGFLCIAGCGGGDYGSPEATLETMMSASEAEDKDAIMDCFSRETRNDFAEIEKLNKDMGVPEKEDQFTNNFKKEADYEIVNEKITGDTATLDIKVMGQIHTYNFVKEDGGWKVNLPELKMGLQMMKSMGGEMQDMMKNMTEQMEEGMDNEMQKSADELQKRMEEMMRKNPNR